MTKEIFLVLNLVLAFYNVGTIWAHEIDIFRTWKYLDSKTFKTVQEVHWKKLPYWVFIPVSLSFLGSLILFWYHPQKIHLWEISLSFSFLVLSNFLTAIFWRRWQANLSKDELGGSSPWLKKILQTHWIRTLLINAYATLLLHMTIQIL